MPQFKRKYQSSPADGGLSLCPAAGDPWQGFSALCGSSGCALVYIRQRRGSYAVAHPGSSCAPLCAVLNLGSIGTHQHQNALTDAHRGPQSNVFLRHTNVRDSTTLQESMRFRLYAPVRLCTDFSHLPYSYTALMRSWRIQAYRACKAQIRCYIVYILYIPYRIYAAL